jgi:hypothetical protein
VYSPDTVVISDTQDVTVVTEVAETFVIEQLAGIQGVIGPIGPQGIQGEIGPANELTVGTVTTSDTMSDVIISGTSPNQTIDFVLQRGPQGIQGIQGEAATIDVGSVTTGAAGTSASIVNSGTTGDAVFDFVIPKGDKGDQGIQGIKGDQGIQGDTGPANSLVVGTVSSTDTAPQVSITGTAPNQTINFVLQRGPQGIQGEQGIQGDPGTGTVNSVNGDFGPDIVLDAADVGAEPAFAAGTTAQYRRGDKTWQTLNKAAVGLSNVDNTSDANKPVSSATQTALDLKAPLNSPTFTGTVAGITKAMVGLSNADNTSDANKPVSTATQTALNAKADLVGGLVPTSQLPPLAINEVFTVVSQAAMLALTAQRGDMAIRTDTGKTYVLSTDAPSTLADWKEVMAGGQVISVAGKTGVVSLVKADVGLGNVDNTSDANKPVSSATQTALNLKANLASPTFTGTVSGITKTMVGLANVDDTSDANKPISTATQTALNAKENTIAVGTTAQFYRGDKTWQTLDKAAVGLANVDNTSDLAKPISTATQTALNGKAASSHTHAIGDLPVATSGTSNTTQLVRADDSRLSNARTPTAHVHAASEITSGVIATARLGSGTADTTTFLRGDNTWQVLSDPTVPIQAAAPTGKADGTFWYDSDDVSADGYANVTRVLHNGTAYPSRPPAAVYVEWIGPVTPTAFITGDTWVNTA